MALISQTPDAHDNAFTELLVVAYVRVQVELHRNFSMSVSHKTPDFIQLNPIGQAPLLDTLGRVCWISKYDMLMKLVVVFEEIVMIWCDNPLELNWYCHVF
ncbi:hypothetical protein KY289_036139 [Solanum tuberosum]|nr:hypothetical protein KY289_036139 [Solanum tuberosum]